MSTGFFVRAPLRYTVTLYDLTRPVENGMPTYPGDPAVSVRPHARMDPDGYRVTALELGTHAGTHVDAPSHVLPDGATLGAFDLDDLRFEARVVDVSSLGPREAIPPNAVPDVGVEGDPRSRDSGPDPVPGPAPVTESDLVLFHTGWAEHWGTERYRAHPYLSPDAAGLCADRGLAVGLDCFGPDPTPPDDGVPAHRAILGEGLPVLENLAGLDRLPERCSVSAFPLRVDADGAPARVVAETAEEPPSGTAE